MCCFAIAKYLLFAFNFVFWLAGAAVLGVGIWLNVDETAKNSVSIAGVDIYYAGAIVFIVAGCCMLVIGFFGCCGAIKESTCLLLLYFICLFIVLGLEIGIGVWAFVSYDSLQAGITGNLNETDLSNATEDNVIYSVEKNLECCGTVNGCVDWNGNVNSLKSYGCGCDPATSKNASNCIPLPATCTADSDPNSPAGTNVFATPCDVAIYNFLSDNLTLIGAIGLAIGLAEILGMIISMCLCCSVKDKD